MNVNKVVLIVDDDYVYKLVTRRMIGLCSAGAEVLFAENGREAIMALQAALNDPLKQLPDIILLDIEMPEMNGWEFLKVFTSLPAAAVADVSIYVVSSSIDDMDLARTKIYPSVKKLITKPFSVGLLRGILNN